MWRYLMLCHFIFVLLFNGDLQLKCGTSAAILQRCCCTQPAHVHGGYCSGGVVDVVWYRLTLPDESVCGPHL